MRLKRPAHRAIVEGADGATENFVRNTDCRQKPACRALDVALYARDLSCKKQPSIILKRKIAI